MYRPKQVYKLLTHFYILNNYNDFDNDSFVYVPCEPAYVPRCAVL